MNSTYTGSTKRTAHLFRVLLLLLALLAANCGMPQSTQATKGQPGSGGRLPSASGMPSPAAPALAAMVPPSLAATAASARASSAPPGTAGVTVLRADGSVVLLRGAEEVRLTTVGGRAPNEIRDCSDYTLRWSPNGHRLALADGIRTIGARAQVAHAPLPGLNPRWSPDGRRLAYLATSGQDVDLLMVAGPDGIDPVELSSGHWSRTGSPSWSPDGQRLIAGAQIAATIGSSTSIAPPTERGTNATWDRSGSSLTWLAADGDAARLRLRVVSWDGRARRDLATLTFQRDQNEPAGSFWWTDPGWGLPPLVWLPDNSGLLVAVAPLGLRSGSGTYLVRRDGSTRLVTPHLLCDMASDGQSLLARTAGGEIVAVSLSDGTVLARHGRGEAAAWRPAPNGPTPSSPLAERSPTLSLREPRIRGEAVREVQQRLRRLGYRAGAVDGIYGPLTAGAVRAFQQRSGLTIDGVVGPQTWAALRSPTPCPASGSPDLCPSS